MPGHAVGENPERTEYMLSHMKKLDKLIQEHDVIFLLLDSREARWLPTILSQVHQKICLTVALGFDTFLVMRHGLSYKDHNKESDSSMINTNKDQGKRLGCYFCNDVVAPRNSL